MRSANVAPATLEGEMWTLRMFAEHLEQIDAVKYGVSDSVGSRSRRSRRST